MSSAAKSPSKEALVRDMKKLHKSAPEISRNFYRANGKYAEAQWQVHFSKFSDFLAAAGITPEQNSSTVGKADETDETVGDVRTITLPKTRIHTLDELLDHAKVDLSVWEVERFKVNKWEMGYVNKGTGEASEHALFQVTATLRRRPDVVAAKKEIEKLKEEAKKSARIPSVIIRPTGKTGNMLEVNIPDAHFGKLAWGAETMHENYDTAIAEQMYLRALETLIERTKGYKFDQVLFVVGNDLLNSDDLENRTTRGTIVTTDGRYYKTFRTVRRTITACIERLRKIAPVKVIMVSGNHDNLSVWHLGDSLEIAFAKYEDVEIDNAPTPRKYHQHGNVMLMLTHGDKGKRQEYPQLMASERHEMWGATKFRECHTGHTHMTKTDEKYGVRVRVLPALCPPDDWHSENGYVGNLRNAEAYVWNNDEGLIAQVFYNDDSQPPITTRRELVAA